VRDDTPDRFAVLRAALALSRWDDDAVWALVERSCELHLAKGHVLIDDNATMMEWYVVVDGTFEVRVASGLRRVAGAGSVIAAADSEGSPVQATALSACIVLALSSPDEAPSA
jgi:hypothetical protein